MGSSPPIDPAARVAAGPEAMAVTPHHLATQAALDVMRAGNAVDGAIAANAVLGVVAPETCGIGGDLFALVHVPGRDAPHALNASGRAGSGVSAAALREAGLRNVRPHGPESVTVPGCVDGWEELTARFGSLPLARCLAPARAAADGFPVSPELARALERRRPALASQPAAQALYPGGGAPPPGTTVGRPDLAATLDAVAAHGREGFYGGEAGRGIVAATGGAVTADDLARSQADWVEALGYEVLGRTGWTIPPNSQGWLTLAAAAIFEHVAGDAAPGEPGWAHAQIEAYRAVAWERNDRTADPDHAPPGPLLDAARLAARAAEVSPARAGTWPAAGPAPGGTAYLCTIDRHGVGVSLIQSNFYGLGSGLGAGHSGVLLHNRGAGFNLEPGHPNELAPGKRPLHTLSPTVWTRGGRLDLLLGTRGGHQQPQLLLQAATQLLRAGDAPGTAQDRPRWAIDDRGGQSAVQVEDRMGPDVVAGLRTRGHDVTVAGPWMEGWGPISIIAVSASGERTGGADPRVSTAAAAAG